MPTPKRAKLPKARLVLVRSTRLLYENWQLFGGILLVYAVLEILFVHGFSSNSHITTLKNALDSKSSGSGSQISNAFLITHLAQLL